MPPPPPEPEPDPDPEPDPELDPPEPEPEPELDAGLDPPDPELEPVLVLEEPLLPVVVGITPTVALPTPGEVTGPVEAVTGVPEEPALGDRVAGETPPVDDRVNVPETIMVAVPLVIVDRSVFDDTRTL